jgi:phosphate transport system substrate-binding protein
VALGAVVPVYNVPGVTKPVRFTGEVLADIYLGKITKWDDKRLQALQEKGVKLPDLPITVVRRADSSATTYLFTSYLAKLSPEWKQKVGVGTAVVWPVGLGVAASVGTSALVKRTPGAIGYVELVHALKDKIDHGAVQNREGHFVRADLKSVTAAARVMTRLGTPEDLRFALINEPGKETYPICGTTWAVMRLNVNAPAGRARAGRDFLRWVTHEGQECCAPLHYAPLPRELVKQIDAALGQGGAGK